jgi:hypothetical protein
VITPARPGPTLELSKPLKTVSAIEGARFTQLKLGVNEISTKPTVQIMSRLLELARHKKAALPRVFLLHPGQSEPFSLTGLADFQ